MESTLDEVWLEAFKGWFGGRVIECMGKGSHWFLFCVTCVS